MKKTLSILSILFLFNLGQKSFAQVNHVVISQVYGGGGNSGATYKNDFIELFNPTASPISLAGWSLQYASATGSFTLTTVGALTPLSGTILPGGYFLVQEANGTGGTTNLPTPDATGSIGLSGTVGKVVLVKTTSAIGGTCPTGTLVVDFVGYGTTANCYEGTGPAPQPANPTSVSRGSNGCTDTDQNASDFTVGAPNPRNSASAANCCFSMPVNTPTAVNVPLGAAYSYTVSVATASSYGISAGSLPAGLNFNTTTGVISGTATSAVMTTADIAATNCAGTSTATYTFNVTNNAVSFTGGANQTFTVCQDVAATSINSLLQISDADVNQVETWSVTAAPANGVIVSGGTQLSNGSTVTPSGFTYQPNALFNGTDAFTVQVDDGSGTPVATTIMVTVNAPPTVSATSATICAGATATLTASGATSYSWNTSETTTSVSPTPTTTTNYTVTGTDANNCKNTAIAVVTVNALPSVSVNSGAICTGATAILTASGATTYTWSTTETTATINPVPTTLTDYTVTGTDANNCSNFAVATVTVNALPVISVTGTASCAGATTTLTASGASTYTWSTTETTASISPTPTITTDYTVTGTDINNCVNTTVATATVNALPVVSANGTDICAGATATLTASGASTYTWSTTETTASISPTPTTTTDYTVTGTDANNCMNTAVATVTVNPLPTITSISGNTSICEGSSTTLTVNSSATTYTWSANASSANTSTVTISPNATDTYTVTVATGLCSTTATVNVHVTSTPTLNITGNTTICAGQTTTLTASGATNYTWTPGNSHAAIVHVPALNSTASFTLTGSTSGCVSTLFSSINVNPSPTVTINSASSPICAGDVTSLDANGALSYTWSTTETTTTITPTPTTTTNYTVTGSDINNCKSMAVATVTVNALPTLSVNSIGVCPGETGTLTATGTATTYTWSTGDNTASISPTATTTTDFTVTGTDGNNCVNMTVATITVNTLPTVTVNNQAICTGGTATLTAGGAATYTWSTSETTATITPTPTATTTDYTVTGTDNNNCVNMAVATVTVNSLPTVTVNSATICAGATATLTASGTATSYVWSNGAFTNSITVTPTGTTSTIIDYTVSGTGANNCANMAVASVTVNALPILSVNSATVCAAATATLTASGTATSYTWSTGVNTNSITATPIATTNYTITGTDGNNCVNMAVANVAVLPAFTITFMVSPNTFCTTDPAAALTASPAGGTFSGVGVSGNTFSPATAGAGTYTLTYTYTDANSCTNTDNEGVTVQICSGINSFVNNENISIYPNPATDAFYLQTNTAFDNATIEVYDMIGQKVLAEKLQNNTTRISLNNLVNAFYQIRVLNNNTLIYQSRIVKQQ